MSKLSRGLILSVAGGVVLYVAFAAFSDFNDVKERLAEFSWWTAGVGLLLAAGNYGLRFVRWQLYLRRLGLDVPRGRSLGIFLAGFSLTVTPGKVGEVLKSYLLRESDGVPISRSAPIVIAERVTDLIACLLLILVGIGSAEPTRQVLVAAGFGAGCVALLVLAVASPRIGDIAIGLAARLPLVGRAAPKLREFHRTTGELLAPGPLLSATVLSAAAWISECGSFWIVIHGFRGASAPFGLAVFIYAATTIAGAMSFLPGGLGVQEGAMMALLVAAAHGVDKPTAFAATFVTRLCTLWFAVLVGFIAVLWVQRRVRVDLGAVEKLREPVASASQRD